MYLEVDFCLGIFGINFYCYQVEKFVEFVGNNFAYLVCLFMFVKTFVSCEILYEHSYSVYSNRFLE